MDRRTRSLARNSLTRTEPFLKYLKPGALARLRDSRISTAKSHRISSLFQIFPSSPPSKFGQPFSAAVDCFPCFAATTRVFGSRCLQRKKLIAAKEMLLLNSTQSDPVVDLLTSE